MPNPSYNEGNTKSLARLYNSERILSVALICITLFEILSLSRNAFSDCLNGRPVHTKNKFLSLALNSAKALTKRLKFL